jgi:hypothetical protein
VTAARITLSTLLFVGTAFFCTARSSTFPLGHARSADVAPPEKACVSALTNLGSYGAWTEEMVAVLGNKQELKFSFYHP